MKYNTFIHTITRLTGMIPSVKEKLKLKTYNYTYHDTITIHNTYIYTLIQLPD